MPSQEVIDGLWMMGSTLVFIGSLAGLAGIAVWLGFRKEKP